MPTAQTPDTPPEVRDRAASGGRVPDFDPRLGIEVALPAAERTPPHRLVALGDSLTSGFQSGAVFATDLSYPAIIAHELGWRGHRRPRYGGPGGLPFNLEVLLRELEERYGASLSLWEVPLALLRAREWLDGVEDYWERGPGSVPPVAREYSHALAVHGWDLRDVLDRTAAGCEAAIERPEDGLLDQVVEHHGERAALHVYPRWSDAVREQTLLQAAQALGEQGDGSTPGIETLIVFLGANNCLGSVTQLRVAWSGDGYADLAAKGAYTVWRPEHFRAEYDALVAQVEHVRARHVIWCTVPHVTIAPIARGLGTKTAPGSRYFPYYARPWVDASSFDPTQDPHLTAGQARAVDAAVDCYNDVIEGHVRRGRRSGRDWYLLDIAGLLDRLASRRYVQDPNARPDWWTPYPLPPALAALRPVPDSRFLTADGRGGRAAGGLFSLDGVHPTTVCYGLIAQEMIDVMRLAGVDFAHADSALRTGRVDVDFARLLRRDLLVRRPPQLLDDSLEALAWADETLDWVRRALST